MHRCAFLLLAVLTLAACPAGNSKLDTGQPEPAVDADGDGYVSTMDCDDSEPEVHPGADELCDGVDNDCDGFVDHDDPSVVGQLTSYEDGDADGYGDPSSAVTACSVPSGYVADSSDCDDDDATVNPGADELCDGVDNDCDGLIDDDDPDLSGASTWYLDSDGDGHGDPGAGATTCLQPSDHVDQAGDCDDADATVHSGADELCDGVDNDCDGDTDEADAIDPSTFYADGDGDGYGDPWSTTTACSVPSGYVADDSDCDDTDVAVNPGASEVCDGVDDDCDGLVDQDDPSLAGSATWYLDSDGDGYGDPSVTTAACFQPSGHVADASDCDDADASANPGADELCDGVDNDCDGATDEADAIDASTFYGDGDGDGYGDPSSTTAACSAPSGFVADSDDCDDGDAAINPGASELCDSVDNDCDGLVDDDDAPVSGGSTWYSDSDGDGYGDSSSGVAACTQPAGTVADDSDCDDSDAAVNPAASELCDGVDNDCDGLVDDDDTPVSGTATWYADSDGDSFGDPGSSSDACSQPSGSVADSTDCDDEDGAINPDADEQCDGVDNDCDGTTDDDAAVDAGTWYLDSDGDSYGDAATVTTACSQPSGHVADGTDCDDGDAAINPAASETCNGYDDDCDGLVDDDDGGLTGATTWYLDLDADGYGIVTVSSTSIIACSRPSGYAATDTDCDDGDPAVHPGAAEQCNGYDDDCDGLVDDDDSAVTGATTWYIDADLDGYGDATTSTTACSEPSGYVADDADCDDGDDDINPGASEACDGLDNDCDGTVDSSAVCPCNVENYGSHAYLFCEVNADWWEAEEDCSKAESYDLVTIDDASEQTWVHGIAFGYASSYWWWIGYNDIDAESWEEPASAWEWNDGGASTYTNWASTQPDDDGGDEDCAHIYGDVGTWNDLDCDRKEWYGTDLYYICESG